MLEKLKDFFIRDEIGEPPWEYNFLVNLEESEYPKYLAKIFNYRTGEKLPLKYDFKQQAWVIDKKRCKTFNQKIQWLKLYGVTDLIRRCTDKVAVRDYVAEKIGSEYLKPVLQIIPENCRSALRNLRKSETRVVEGKVNDSDSEMNNLPERQQIPREPSRQKIDDFSNYFDQINWDKLPNAFVIKCNHGCKWQYIIKNKEQFLNTPQLVEIVKKNITGWLEQEYFPWNGFEMQYKGIEPKILIEPLMRDDINIPCPEIHIYCFLGIPKFIIKLHNDNGVTLFDENLNYINDVFSEGDIKVYEKADDLIKQTYDLSIKLVKKLNFEMVRVDWMIYQNKLYFEEFTFTPYAGFHQINKKLNELVRV